MSTLTLKHGDSFAVLDRGGDIGPGGRGEPGLYHRGTRRLSRAELRLDGRKPVLLSAQVTPDAPVAVVDLATPDMSVHVQRTLLLWRGALWASIRLVNYGGQAATQTLALDFASDFADVFEVRGIARLRHGRRWSKVDSAAVVLGCDGLDGVIRRTRLAFSLPPAELAEDGARFALRLEPGLAAELIHTVSFDDAPAAATAEGFAAALQGVRAEAGARPVRLSAANPLFAGWLERSAADLRMLETATPDGPYPYAGVPWFSTVFGRDGILAALACLWLDPAPARAVLLTLAASQAEADDPVRHAEPGKILHEWRDGEMAALGEVPYGRYYASADATPLFVMLAAAYWRRTADRATLERLWPHVVRALEWIDRSGDGFVEYGHPGPQTAADRDWKQGLANQGWKDSEDAVMHADGSLAEGPIALAEIQAYVFAARQGAAEMAAALGRAEDAARLRLQAAALQARFEAAFWLEDRGTYALALDGYRRPCRVSTSNAGHVLFCGIASPERARRVADTLMGPALFTGWGIRTLAEGERRYNPMAYHNGAVWPHDTAIAAAGLARYGRTDQAARLLEGLYEAALVVDLHRLPELFCGFPRRAGRGPVGYPIACAPQAWAASSVFLLLQAVLGLDVTADPPALTFRAPMLPDCLGGLEIGGLEVGGVETDLVIGRRDGRTVVEPRRGADGVAIRVES